MAIRGVTSNWRNVWSGVPQGSGLGPTLFLIYVNDLLDDVQSEGKLFADDAKIYRCIRDSDDQKQLQVDLDKLQEWSDQWFLKFNTDKCKKIGFGPRNPNFRYSMGGTQLTHSQQESDLGVVISSDLKPSTQVAKGAYSANSMLGRIRKTFTCLNEKILPPLYKALVRPRMEFAIQTWSPYLRKDVQKLEKIQRRATKLVPSLSNLPYEARLKALGLTTLEERRIHGDMLETFKILKGFDKVDADSAFLALDQDQRRTRGHQLKFIKPRHRTFKRNAFFTARVVDIWNRLPEQVINSTSVNQFKRRYDQYMSNTQ